VRILIAEDEPISRLVLQSILTRWGYEVITATDGDEAWEALHGEDPPRLAILDWIMPGLEGDEICRRLRAEPGPRPTYVILLTSKDRREDTVAGLKAGADDYVPKPFDPEELRARLQVGVRMVELQKALADRIGELEALLSQVKQLHGLLPICSYCKKVRDDQNYWQQVEDYISEHSEVRFSHGICPDCYIKHIEPQLEMLPFKKKAKDRRGE
jgi:sigma-B regulation protein RsbU (phosphoserine phosphatase)